MSEWEDQLKQLGAQYAQIESDMHWVRFIQGLNNREANEVINTLKAHLDHCQLPGMPSSVQESAEHVRKVVGL